MMNSLVQSSWRREIHGSLRETCDGPVAGGKAPSDVEEIVDGECGFCEEWYAV